MWNLNGFKKILIDEFQDIDSVKMFIVMGVLDNLRIVLITQDFEDVQKITKVLRDDVFSLVEISSN